MTAVDQSEVLLLWRALRWLRSGKAPGCAATGRPPVSVCPLHDRCPRWRQADDYQASLDETVEQTERRRASWPCSRLLDLLSPEANDIGRR